MTTSFGPSVASGLGLLVGDALAGSGDEPLAAIGDGVPLGRTRKTGPDSFAVGVVVGSGTGDAVALQVGRGVGGTISCAPLGGTGGIGISDGLALGFGLAVVAAPGSPLAAVAGALADAAGSGVPVGVGVGASVAAGDAGASATLIATSVRRRLSAWSAAASSGVALGFGIAIRAIVPARERAIELEVARQSCAFKSAATVGSSGCGFAGSALAGTALSHAMRQSAKAAVTTRARRSAISVRPGRT